MNSRNQENGKKKPKRLTADDRRRKAAYDEYVESTAEAIEDFDPQWSQNKTSSFIHGKRE